MSAQPSNEKPSKSLRELYLLNFRPHHPKASFVFIDYKGMTYPGSARLIDTTPLKGNFSPSECIVEVERNYAPAPSSHVEELMKEVPGIVRLKVSEKMDVRERRFYARTLDTLLVPIDRAVESKVIDMLDRL